MDINQNKIIKIIENETGYTYIIREANNEFVYVMGDNQASKRRKTSSPSSSRDDRSSVDSTPSASSWGSLQKERFKIHFKSGRSASSTFASEFELFFEKKEPSDVPQDMKPLCNLDFFDEIPTSTLPINKKINQHAQDYQLRWTESTAEDFFKVLLEVFGEHPVNKVRLEFGTADIVLQRPFNGSQYMACVIEIKGGKPYNLNYQNKYRLQLASYMISLAMDNSNKIQIKSDGQHFAVQRIYGILVMGITPIFYRADFTQEYIESIGKDPSQIPDVTVMEFAPIDPYTDREFLRKTSRPLIIKCLQALFEGAKFEMSKM